MHLYSICTARPHSRNWAPWAAPQTARHSEGGLRLSLDVCLLEGELTFDYIAITKTIVQAWVACACAMALAERTRHMSIYMSESALTVAGLIVRPENPHTE